MSGPRLVPWMPPSPRAFAAGLHAAELRLGQWIWGLGARPLAWLALAFALACGSAQAQSEPGQASIAATMLKYLPALLDGFAMNILIGVLATLIGTVTGLLLGIGQLSLFGPVRGVSFLATQLFRNTPTMVLLFYITTLVPTQATLFDLEITIWGWLKATLAISLSTMSNTAEVVRGTVQTTPQGQWDGAYALGFSRGQALWRVILPQGLPLMIPPLLGYFIVIVMATTLASVVGVAEVLATARFALSIEEGRDELLAPMYLMVLLLFFLSSYAMTQAVALLQRRLIGRKDGGAP
jgi:polar amino acid transport system permease protein